MFMQHHKERNLLCVKVAVANQLSRTYLTFQVKYFTCVSKIEKVLEI
jgi:hypothetical protein